MSEAVTVVLPVYNAMPYLPAAVDSLLRQSLVDFRLLIIDDGSTDSGRAYLDTIRDPRVQVIHRDNWGLGATLNQGIELCRTEYLARMDADDVCEPSRLQEQLAYMQKHPSVVMLGPQLRFLINGKVQAAPPAPLDHADIESRLLAGRAGVCHPTIMVRTDAARAVGGYRLRGAGEDVDFCIRMCERGIAANLDRVLHNYRLHLNSLGASRQRELRLGYAYAIATARCRRRGAAEPTLQEFAAEWESRGIVRRSLECIEDWSGLQYRKGRIELAQRRWIGCARLACAAACRPSAAARFAANALRTLLS
jgi:glycosyltransferase involved in cell wall biosynthesis